MTVEVRSPQAGIIAERYADEGDEVSVNNPLFALMIGGSAPVQAAAAPAAKAPAVNTKIETGHEFC